MPIADRYVPRSECESQSPRAASDATQAIVAKHGARGLTDALDWLGSKDSELLASRQVVWEQDPYARGGYAYFDSGFDPSLRTWLSRPAGRLFFAGEHTSPDWSGTIEGALRSGERAAADVLRFRRSADIGGLHPGG